MNSFSTNRWFSNSVISAMTVGSGIPLVVTQRSQRCKLWDEKRSAEQQGIAYASKLSQRLDVWSRVKVEGQRVDGWLEFRGIYYRRAGTQLI